ncbi:MAG: RnfABCDGE type electron transport complex subunit D [Candidatus Eisenbacteria bacterium]|nr:RnfABCDGE type electron transport complex subunit D [Candidatus Eisenbacteria bacterium]
MPPRHEPPLLLHTSPFLKRQISTPQLMRDVLLALAPVMLAAIWFFGIAALLVVAAAVAGSVVTEWGLGPQRPRSAALKDGSAILTGVLLGLVLPPGIPLWMAFVGGVAGVGLGKLIWGGLGQNLFNPALVGRAFLQAAFPTTLTTWTAPEGPSKILGIRGASLAAPFLQSDVDVVSTATPLSLMKFQGEITDWTRLLIGNTAGSLGETSAGLIILAGIWLAARRTFDWRIPVSILGSVAVLSTVLFVIAPDTYPGPWFMLLSGGLLFGAIYMATDPVTSPISARSTWIFGAGIGTLVVLIRLFGGLPEGVMYAILLMNAAAPLLERSLQPRAFGREGRA